MEEQQKLKSARPKSRQSLAHLPSRANTTTDIAALKRDNEAKEKSKRTRGKSLGPGGLEALTETSANALKIPPVIQPRSILKPTIPLTPPKVIPSFDELRKKSSTKGISPGKNVVEDLLIDFSTPGPGRSSMPVNDMPGMDNIVDPFSLIAHSNKVREKASTDKDEEQRQAEKKAIMEQRAARRKSLAKRRVSFAPEATLHTWSVMELAEDSTTSSASNSTRRQSSMVAAQSLLPQISTPGTSHETERPSTPIEQENGEVVSDTPGSQRKLHQRKRRRSSDNAHSSDEEAFSSPGDSGDSSPIRIEDSIDSESDTDGDTAMSLDEATANTIRSSDSSSTQTSLDERLRQAASQAGTRGIAYDEDGTEDEEDESMEIADSTVTYAFKPYAGRGHSNGSQHALINADDKENVKLLEQDQSNLADANEDDEATSSMTMDVTRAVGGIVSNSSSIPTSNTADRRRSNASRRRSSGVDSSYGDETMDMTVAKGGILSNHNENDENNKQTSDEEMAMEVTGIVGGVNNTSYVDVEYPTISEDTGSMDMAMDMTLAAGGILPPIEEQTELQSYTEDNMTGAMDITRAVGKILSQPNPLAHFQDVLGPKLPPERNSPGVQLNEELSNMMVTSTEHRDMTPAALENGSPTLKPRLSARRGASMSQTTTPRSLPKQKTSGISGDLTPSKQLTPAPAKSTSPKRTPILSASVTQRSASPKKLFAKEIQQRASPTFRKSPKREQDILFAKDETTGLHTPRVALHAPKPHQHLRGRSSGVGVNGGTGSPRISEILSRRTSIGDVAANFEVQQGPKRRIQFRDLQQIEQEIDAERAEEHRRESGRFVMEREACGQQDENTTQNLKEMIESMTPKKEKSRPKLKGRKSLAVGSARGLLGKRPAELDVDDEDDNDGESTPKRLKTVSREGSPVKKVHLPKPPTKEQTTGRLSKAEQRALTIFGQSTHTPTLPQSPAKQARSPERTGRFANPASAEKPTSFEERFDNVVGATDISTTHPELLQSVAEEEKISLQQFLNLTNIHFIELSTTKRRHTMVQALPDGESGTDISSTSSANFMAAATTLPLLELYQHATKELKSYISSGRKIIRTIEAETFNEQPAIFQEYVDARPDLKAVMDHQFRNGKTNARLQSKEGWYTWRSQLVDGLQTGLEGIKTDLEKDKEVLTDQQRQLDEIVPAYVGRKQQLEQQLTDLRRLLTGFDSLDHGTLKTKRQQLAALDKEVSQRSEQASELTQQMQEKEEVLLQAAELRQEMNDQITEAARVQEEQRRWHTKDVSSHKASVEKLEKESGWKVLTAEDDVEDSNGLGVALTLMYKNQLRLFFYPSAFQTKTNAGRRRSGRKSRSVSGPYAPISLTYSPDEHDERLPKELPTELRFALQLMQGQLHAFTMMPKGSVTCQTLLRTVSECWTLAKKLAGEIKTLKSAGMVRVSIKGDEKLAATLMLMQPGRSRIDIEFTFTVTLLNDGEYSANTNISATPIYGPMTSFMDASKTRKVQHALSKEVESKDLGSGSCLSAINGFKQWLQTQSQQAKQEPQPQTLRAKSVAKPQPKTQAQPQTQPTSDAPPTVSQKETRRALTHSPPRLTSITPKPPTRSPLAPRTTNRMQKKALPVPKRPFQLTSSQEQSLIPTAVVLRDPIASQQKENLVPVAEKLNNADGENGIVNGVDLGDDVFGGAKPAIPPEMQEAMMHTPVKRRVGALRRSPI